MTDENITTPQSPPVDTSRAEERIKQLSDKVESTSKERDEKLKLIEERDVKIASLERENTFNTGFGDILSTHSSAKDHKDEIREKVLAGMNVEDATYAVLGKAGKLVQPTQPLPNPAGGSASMSISHTGDKPIADMTQEERRSQLAKDLIWQ